MDEYNKLKEKFKKRITDLIDNKKDLYNVSEAQQAEKLGISFGTLAKYRRGEILPRADVLFEIAKYYNVSTDYVLGLSNSKLSNINDRVMSVKLGLSDLSIKKLKEANKYRIQEDFFQFREIINFLIENHFILQNLNSYFKKGITMNEEKEYLEIKNKFSKNSEDELYKMMKKEEWGNLLNRRTCLMIKEDNDWQFIKSIENELKELKYKFQDKAKD